jgi:hypothetical protein
MVENNENNGSGSRRRKGIFGGRRARSEEVFTPLTPPASDEGGADRAEKTPEPAAETSIRDAATIEPTIDATADVEARADVTSAARTAPAATDAPDRGTSAAPVARPTTSLVFQAPAGGAGAGP